ncbi:MAG: hypothetical protein ACYSR9_01720 [Planctomycetota bacterium]|jgi:hypothetical protein
MTHEDTGKYAAKHPPGTTLNEQIAETVRQKSSNGGLTCATGEKISKELGIEIPEVGITADLLEIKINRCQLGLFGYGNKPEHGKDIQAADSVSDEIKTALEEVSENGEVTCAALWKVADSLDLKRKTVASACDALKLKIRVCQLGAF